MSENATQAPQGFTALGVAERLAPTWASRREQIEAVSAPCTAALLRDLDPKPGDTVLELAAGTGDTGFDAAERVGAEGRLISSDFSPAMLDEARRRGAERGIKNVEYEVIDAAKIGLEDDSVDGVLCRFGYMLMHDPEAALAETRRVLRPGGKVAFAVWASPERNPFFMIPAISLIQRGHMPPPQPPPAPGLFSMADPERVKGLLHDAGFEEARVEEVPLTFPLPNANAYLEFMADTAGPLAIALQGLSKDQRAEVLADVEDSLARFAAEGSGYPLPGLALCAVGELSQVDGPSVRILAGSALVALVAARPGRRRHHNLVSPLGPATMGSPTSCAGFNRPTDIVGVAPRIARLRSNGGPTQTIALRKGSAAINRVDRTEEATAAATADA